MSFPVVREWCLHATGVFVVVVSAALFRVPAARIEPDFRVARHGVHSTRFKWVEEHNAIDCQTNRPHRRWRNLLGGFGHQRNAEGEVLRANRVRVSAVGELGGGVIGEILRFEDQERVVVTHLEVGYPILVGIARLGEQIDELVGVAVEVGVRLAVLPFLDVPPAADGFQPDRYGRRRVLFAAKCRFRGGIQCRLTSRTFWTARAAGRGTAWTAGAWRLKGFDGPLLLSRENLFQFLAHFRFNLGEFLFLFGGEVQFIVYEGRKQFAEFVSRRSLLPTRRPSGRLGRCRQYASGEEASREEEDAKHGEAPCECGRKRDWYVPKRSESTSRDRR